MGARVTPAQGAEVSVGPAWKMKREEQCFVVRNAFWICLFTFFISLGCSVYVLITILGEKNMITKKFSQDRRLDQQTDTLTLPKTLSHKSDINGVKMKNFKIPPQNPAYAHIGFDIPHEEAVPEFGEHMKLKLKPDGNKHGVNVTSDGIVVLYSGLYHVYVSITTKLYGINCTEVTYKEWNHYIRRTIHSDSVTLLKTVHSCSENEHTKFQAGVFYLEAGNVITAACSAHNLVRPSQESSFIGTYLIKSGLNPMT